MGFAACIRVWFILAVAAIVAVSPASSADMPPLAVFSDCLAEAAGNAHWTIDGGYSRWADLLRERGWRVESVSQRTGGERIVAQVLRGADVFVLPEPNTPLSSSERELVLAFTRDGGGLVVIGDHGGADRNFDGKDSCAVLNELTMEMGFYFVGDTVSEAPVHGPLREHPVTFAVANLGIWGGTSIEITPRCAMTPLATSDKSHLPVLVAGQYGKGRVVAFGDSSPFDDGTGDAEKALHDSMDSFLYEHNQLAVNMIFWASGDDEPPMVPQPLPRDDRAALSSQRAANILVDAAHGSDDADKLGSWAAAMEAEGFRVHYGFTRLSRPTLDKFRLVLIESPSDLYLDREVAALRHWLREGGRLLISGASDRNELTSAKPVNCLLGGLGSTLRMNSDEIVHSAAMCGRPWCLFTAPEQQAPWLNGIERLLLWAPSSIVTDDFAPLPPDHPATVLFRAPPGAIQGDADGAGDAIIYGESLPVVAVFEQVGDGLLALIGANTMTDYQYPGSHVYPPLYRDLRHDTPEFNARLARQLMR